ncbi:unnamed protein product [Camellia sinensis]
MLRYHGCWLLASSVRTCPARNHQLARPACLVSDICDLTVATSRDRPVLATPPTQRGVGLRTHQLHSRHTPFTHAVVSAPPVSVSFLSSHGRPDQTMHSSTLSRSPCMTTEQHTTLPLSSQRDFWYTGSLSLSLQGHGVMKSDASSVSLARLSHTHTQPPHSLSLGLGMERAIHTPILRDTHTQHTDSLLCFALSPTFFIFYIYIYIYIYLFIIIYYPNSPLSHHAV